MAVIPYCGWPGTNRRPLVWEPSLLAYSGFVLEPHLHRFARRGYWQDFVHQAGEVYFETLLRRWVLLRMVGTRLQPRQPELAEQLGHAALVERNREVAGDLRAQINAAPPHNAVFLRIRPFDHYVLQFSHLRLVQRRRASRAPAGCQAGNVRRVVAMHPVA